jgi:hypothetical protein
MAGRGGQGEGVKEGRGGRERGRHRKRRRRAEGDAGKREGGRTEEVPVAAGRGASPSPDECGREDESLVPLREFGVFPRSRARKLGTLGLLARVDRVELGLRF